MNIKSHEQNDTIKIVMYEIFLQMDRLAKQIFLGHYVKRARQIVTNKSY